MTRPLFVGVPLVNGRPDLQLPEGVEITRGGPRQFNVTWTAPNGTSHSLYAWRTSIVAGGKRWFVCTGSRRIFVGLAHLGAAVKRWSDLTAGQKAAVRAEPGLRGIRRVRDGRFMAILPPHGPAGSSPIATGMDGAEEDGEEYVEGGTA